MISLNPHHDPAPISIRTFNPLKFEEELPQLQQDVAWLESKIKEDGNHSRFQDWLAGPDNARDSGKEVAAPSAEPNADEQTEAEPVPDFGPHVASDVAMRTESPSTLRKRTLGSALYGALYKEDVFGNKISKTNTEF